LFSRASYKFRPYSMGHWQSGKEYVSKAGDGGWRIESRLKSGKKPRGQWA